MKKEAKYLYLVDQSKMVHYKLLATGLTIINNLYSQQLKQNVLALFNRKGLLLL